jgi:putative transposase
MPRTARSSVGGYCYHVLNRGNGRATVFHKPRDYQAFVALIAEAVLRQPIRLLAYCVMPNHFHLVLWPVDDGDLSRWMHWSPTTHARRYLAHYLGTGHVWQGRFKAFPIEEDEHLRVVLRYIERNPLRASLVERAEQWPWSSLCPSGEKPVMDPGPAPRAAGWIEAVNAAMTEAECASIRTSIRRNRPLGSEAWVRRTAEKLGLEASLRAPGRPPKTTETGGKHPRSPEL